MNHLVLVVEVDPAAAGWVDLYLRSRGARVVVAATAAEALRYLVRTRPDVVLIGHRPPLVDARELMPRLPGSIPRIVMSHADDGELDADAVLTRPLAPAALLAALRWVARQQPPAHDSSGDGLAGSSGSP